MVKECPVIRRQAGSWKKNGGNKLSFKVRKWRLFVRGAYVSGGQGVGGRAGCFLEKSSLRAVPLFQASIWVWGINETEDNLVKRWTNCKMSSRAKKKNEREKQSGEAW